MVHKNINLIQNKEVTEKQNKKDERSIENNLQSDKGKFNLSKYQWSNLLNQKEEIG